MKLEAVHIIRISTHTVECRVLLSRPRDVRGYAGMSGGLEPRGARIVNCQS